MEKILVWDWPVRLGHWLLAIAFALAWLTGDSDTFRRLHLLAGAVVLAVASFRLAWGVFGSRHARFSAFVRGPAAVRRYLGSLLARQPLHHTGHNPAGGWAIVLLLGLTLLTGGSGWLLDREFAGHWLEEVHEGLAASMLAVVAVHLAGVVGGSLLHGENLVAAMLSGYKRGRADEAIAAARPLAAVALLLWVALVSGLIAH